MDEFDREIAALKRKDRRHRLVGKTIMISLLCAPLIFLVYRLVQNHLIDQEREEEHAEWLRLKDHEVTELERLIDGARKDLQSSRERWVEAIRPALLDELTPGEDKCHHSFRGPTMGAAKSYIQHRSIDGNYFGNVSFSQHSPGAPIPPNGIDSDLAAIGRAEADLKAGKADRYTLRRIRQRSSQGDELIVVANKTPPIATTGAAGFIPGRVQGRAYLYSPRAGVRCVADIDVRNSPNVEISYSHMQGNFMDEQYKANQAASGALDADLRVNLMWAITSGLRQAERQQDPITTEKDSP